MTDPAPPPAGWYHDGTSMRWWDGTAWGPVAPPGSFGVAPSAPAAPADPVREGTTMAVLCHAAHCFAAVLVALIVLLTEGKKNEYVRHHSTEALNFQLTFLIVWIGGIFLTIGGMFAVVGTGDGEAGAWFLLPMLSMFALLGVSIAFAILGAVRASQGRWWRYPVSIRFVRGARPKHDPR